MMALLVGAVLGTLAGLAWVSVVHHFERRREAPEERE